MKPTSNQQQAHPDARLAPWGEPAGRIVEAADSKSDSRIVHPKNEAEDVIPSGSFPRHGRAKLPPRITAAGKQPPPQPSRVSASDDSTEIISVLPDSTARRRRQQRNRRPTSSVKLLGIALAAQLLLLIFGLVMFKGAIGSWLRGGEAIPQGLLTADEAVALRDELRVASADFADLSSDLKTVKEQVSINPGDAWKQLEILGERNRLTMLADDAIANGSREAFDQLVTLSKDQSRDQRIKDGAAAEILRVKNFYSSGSRLGPYTLPVATLYPSLKTGAEEALSNSQLLALLADQKKHWRVRTRAAYLLGSRRDPSVSEALVQAAKSDPNLDVVKECVFTFEENTGYRAKGLFEIDSLVNWWTVYQARAGVSAGAAAPDPS